MSDQQLTPWFPPHIRPVHVGVYETTHEKDGAIYLPGSGYQRLNSGACRALSARPLE